MYELQMSVYELCTEMLSFRPGECQNSMRGYAISGECW